jgi:hypothetical protein
MPVFDYTRKYRVGVSQYERADAILPYHWAILVRIEKTTAKFYQIKGFSGSFSLDTTQEHENFTRSGSWRGAFEVGTIDVNDLGRFEEVIGGVPILHEEGWNCQSWVVSALRRLQDAKILKSKLTFSQATLLNELKDIEAKWEIAESSFCETE